MSNAYLNIDGPEACFNSDGNQLDVPLGYHAFFVTYVPFLPSFLSDDFTRMIAGEGSRIRLIVSRQIRFLNDLSSCRSGSVETFDLRFVSMPQPGQPYNDIHIFFIGKVFHSDADQARAKAVELWRKFTSYFPLEDPFNYPLQTITEVVGKDGKVRPSDVKLFRLALQPFEITPENARNLIEIRKYEDYDPMLGSAETGTESFVGYFPHPFRPTIDFSAMSRFLETFAVQPQKCVASICLRPTSLALAEQQQISRMMQHYHRLLKASAENWLSIYRKERFDDLIRTFEPMINQRNHLFLVKIQIIGADFPPSEVVAALGSEIMNNSTPEPRLWSEARPIGDDVNIAAQNFRLMEYQPWTKVRVDSPLWRLSSLVSSYEAVGAFRLPIPPESGHMPGLRVLDEPFVTPPAVTPTVKKGFPESYVKVGNIMHRGTETATSFVISLSQLKRHGLVAGSTGSGKTNTCLHILTELWKGTPSVPFLVIYPIDKPDYRLLRADAKVSEQLFIFTLGDDTTSPFRFNPFHVPPGILVRTHMSLLMRAFSAAFSMWDPLPAVYRAALRRSFEIAGFGDLRTAKGGDPNTRSPLLSEFYDILLETSEQMTRSYGNEAKGNIRQGAEIRMRDLLQNAGHVLNVEDGAPWHQILQHPTVMEIGRVGSTEDTTLVMGFLLMSLTSYLASRRKYDMQPTQHITLIEEAHRLMSSKGSGGDSIGDPRAKASEDFANILAEVRGFNEGLLIAEQIPSELVSGAIGNTYVKIMHWLEEQHSFELFADIMNLNKQQRESARTLPTGHAILRSPHGRPVLVKVKDYLNEFQHEDDTSRLDDSDAAIQRFMAGQVERHDLHIPPLVPFTLPNLEAPVDAAVGELHSQRPVQLPMPTCHACEVLHRTGKCKYGITVKNKFFLRESIRQQLHSYVEAALATDDEVVRGEQMAALTSAIQQQLSGADDANQRGMVYCYLAQEVDALLHSDGLPQMVYNRAFSLLNELLSRWNEVSHGSQ